MVINGDEWFTRISRESERLMMGFHDVLHVGFLDKITSDYEHVNLISHPRECSLGT